MRTRLSLFVLILLLLVHSPSSAQTTSDLVDYLNNDFAQKVWPDVENLIGNTIVHGIAVQASNQNATLDRGSASFNLSSAPSFSQGGRGLIARFPASGSYRVVAPITKHINFFPDVSATFEIDISISVDIGALDAITTPTININARGLSGSVLDLLGVTQDIERRVVGSLGDQLGFFNSMRFDPNAPLNTASPDLELILGEKDLTNPATAIDIVIVSDGFSATEISGFAPLADRLAEKVRNVDTINRVSEPFASFDTAIRIWRLNVLSRATDLAQRVVRSFKDSGTNTVVAAVSNLARLAQIGILTDQRVGADVIVHASQFAMDKPRANAYGNLVLLPVLPLVVELPYSRLVTDPMAPTVLVHELGHTLLGGLADENFTVDHSTVRYLGLEPTAPNMSASASEGLRKWSFWANRSPILWDNPVGAFEGGYFFGRDTFRPAAECKMRDSDGEDPFCAVCRESLTRGIRRRFEENMALVEVEYLAPWKNPAETILIESRGLQGSADLEAYPGNTATRVRLKLRASSLPKDWQLTWDYRSALGSTQSSSGQEITMDVRFGDEIRLTISSLCEYIPRDRLDPFTVVLNFRLPHGPSGLLPPENLSQSVPTGGRVELSYDPATGDAVFPLELSADARGFPNWAPPLATRIQFDIEQVTGSETHSFTSAPLMSGRRFTYRPEPLPAGSYLWRAKAVHEGQESSTVAIPAAFHLRWNGRTLERVDYHFSVTRNLSTVPQAPKAPFDLRASGPLTRGGNVLRTIELTARSFDLNGDPLRLEFEVKPQNVPFDGTGVKRTSLLTPPDLGSLVVVDSVVVGPLLDPYRFRVRAVDEGDLASEWTDGWVIESAAYPPVNIEAIDSRLDRIAETFLDGPRLAPEGLLDELGKKADFPIAKLRPAGDVVLEEFAPQEKTDPIDRLAGKTDPLGGLAEKADPRQDGDQPRKALTPVNDILEPKAAALIRADEGKAAPALINKNKFNGWPR